MMLYIIFIYTNFWGVPLKRFGNNSDPKCVPNELENKLHACSTLLKESDPTSMLIQWWLFAVHEFVL